MVDRRSDYKVNTKNYGWYRIDECWPPLLEDGICTDVVMLAKEDIPGSPGYWFQKLGWQEDNGAWHLWGGSWTPTHWRPIIRPPAY